MVKSYLRGQRYKLEKKDKVANLKQNNPKGQNVPSGNTAKKLAQEYKVSEKTIKRDQQYTLGIDKLTENDNALKWQILNKDIDLPKNFVVELLEKTEKEIKQFRDQLKKGNLENAAKSLETAAVPKQKRVNSSPTKIDTLRTEMIKTFKQAAQKKDKEALAKLRVLVDELEKMLFE